jgi:hypothetical protein
MTNIVEVKNALFNDKKEKEWLKTLLRERIVEITFVKADGSDRVMKATLLEEKIPSEKLPKGNSKSQNDEVLPVFDVESDGWRSFRWDSIKQINFTL